MLASALDEELNSATRVLATTAAGAVESTASSAALDELSLFKARQAGATLDIGNGMIVTRLPGDLNRAGALVFKGGDFNSVSNYFESLTGYTWNIGQLLEQGAFNSKGISVFNKVTNLGTFTLRDVTASRGNWTIVFRTD